MGRFLLDAMFVLLLLVIGYGVIRSESVNNDNINSIINSFDSNISNGQVVDGGGYISNGEKIEDYNPSFIGQTIDTFNTIVIKIVDGGFDIFVKVLKGSLS